MILDFSCHNYESPYFSLIEASIIEFIKSDVETIKLIYNNITWLNKAATSLTTAKNCGPGRGSLQLSESFMKELQVFSSHSLNTTHPENK